MCCFCRKSHFSVLFLLFIVKMKRDDGSFIKVKDKVHSNNKLFAFLLDCGFVGELLSTTLVHF